MMMLEIGDNRNKSTSVSSELLFSFDQWAAAAARSRNRKLNCDLCEPLNLFKPPIYHVWVWACVCVCMVRLQKGAARCHDCVICLPGQPSGVKEKVNSRKPIMVYTRCFALRYLSFRCLVFIIFCCRLPTHTHTQLIVSCGKHTQTVSINIELCVVHLNWSKKDHWT